MHDPLSPAGLDRRVASIMRTAPVPPRWLYPAELELTLDRDLYRKELAHHAFSRDPDMAINISSRLIAALGGLPEDRIMYRGRNLLAAERVWCAWMQANRAKIVDIRKLKLTAGLAAAARRASGAPLGGV